MEGFALLARIWLDKRHGVRPEQIEELPLGVSARKHGGRSAHDWGPGDEGARRALP